MFLVERIFKGSELPGADGEAVSSKSSLFCLHGSEPLHFAQAADKKRLLTESSYKEMKASLTLSLPHQNIGKLLYKKNPATLNCS